MMTKKFTPKVILVFCLITFLTGCGFVDRYLNEEKWATADAIKTEEHRKKFEALIKPHIGKSREEIRKIFGEPREIKKYPLGSKVAYDADEVWTYDEYEKTWYGKDWIGWYTFFFKDDKLIKADFSG